MNTCSVKRAAAEADQIIHKRRPIISAWHSHVPHKWCCCCSCWRCSVSRPFVAVATCGHAIYPWPLVVFKHNCDTLFLSSFLLPIAPTPTHPPSNSLLRSISYGGPYHTIHSDENPRWTPQKHASPYVCPPYLVPP